MTLPVVLAHAGAGHTWQAMVVLAGFALTGVLLAAAIGKLRMGRPDDLVMPLAVIAIATSLAPMASTLLSDLIGAGLPLGVVSLAALLLAAFTPLDIRLPAPLAMGAIALAIVASVMLYRPFTIALHPPADELPLADDSEVAITAPQDEATVSAGTVEVVVEITGGSIGPGELTVGDVPDDPEEAGALAVALQELEGDEPVGTQQRLEVDHGEGCSVDDPCDQVSFPIEVEAGEHRLTVEFLRGDGTPFATNIRERITFTAE